MVFSNPAIHTQWKEAWLAKEEALKTRYVKTLESLNEHTRVLPKLNMGDLVMIQNQSGRFPKKWDKSGVVIEIKNNDQYLVKVDGSGRPTLRNRRFLRRYKPHGGSRHAQVSNAYVNNFRCAPSCEGAMTPDENVNGDGARSSTMQEPSMPPSDHSPASPQCPPPSLQCPPPSLECLPISPQCTPPCTPTCLTPAPVADFPAVEQQEQQHLRPRRERKQREVYDPSTGKSVAPQAVPEEI